MCERRHLQDMAGAAFCQRKEDVAGVTGPGRDAASGAPGLDERVQLGLRRRHRGALFQPSDEIEIVVVARPALVPCEGERQPDFRVVVHEIRAARHDADDLKPPSVDVDAVADDWLRAERGLPELVRDHSHRRRAGNAGLSASKEAPLSGLHAERVQQVRIDDGRADATRAIARHEIRLAGAEGADIGEGAVELLELQVLGHRGRELRKPERWQLGVQVHQLRGARVRERPQQHAVDDREDGGVRADPERERDDRHRCKDRRASERPQPVMHVADQILEPRQAALIAQRIHRL